MIARITSQQVQNSYPTYFSDWFRKQGFYCQRLFRDHTAEESVIGYQAVMGVKAVKFLWEILQNTQEWAH